MAAWATATPAAHAATSGSFEKIYERATAAYAKGDYTVAVELFLRAYEGRPEPVTLYSLSSCFLKLGDKVKALEYAERYLGTAHEGPERPKATARATDLHLELGLSAKSLGDCPRALEHFARAQALGGRGAPLVHAGGCREALGEASAARAAYEAALADAGLAPDLRALAKARVAALDKGAGAATAGTGVGAAAPRRRIRAWVPVVAGAAALVAGGAVLLSWALLRPRDPDLPDAALGTMAFEF